MRIQERDRQAAGENRSQRAWYALFVLPFAGLLIVPIYASEDPKLFGFPFFYWYQFLWVPLTALIIWFVYTRVR